MVHTTRRAAAGAAVLLWAGGMVTLAHRQQKPLGLDGEMTQAATHFNPGPAYYLVERDGRQIGFASTSSDTTPTGLQFDDYLIIEAQHDSTRRMAVHSRAKTSRRFVLQSLDAASDTSAGWTHTAAEVADSTLTFRTLFPTVSTRTTRAERDMLAPDAIPMIVGMGGETTPRVGSTRTFKVVDVAGGRVAPVTFRIAAESLFSIADSAVFDNPAQRWRTATVDTVRAWELVPQIPMLVATSKLSAWVDGQGRIVDADVELAGAGAVRFRRMCYELAYRNWPGRRFK
ncbi:MAG TPA: hypothetical protein VFA43_09340 [Gemmatimonadaceae bacterium]|nr:hypothetical protein [Gemmatimonadaceae bacterium]